MPIKPQPTHRQANVINLMDALRRSVEGDKAKPRQRRRQERRRRAAEPAARRAQGQGAHEEGGVTAGAPWRTSSPARLPPQAQLHAHRGAARQAARARPGDLFVVHKHAARRLHYDLRLELDGVLKSWAVTRGPSLSPADKRLAVRVEDHPLDYAEFEGRIPEGEYGAGSVIVWDRGRWSTEGDPHQQLAKGHLEFELEGSKLKGRWHLVHMKGARARAARRTGC